MDLINIVFYCMVTFFMEVPEQQKNTYQYTFLVIDQRSFLEVVCAGDLWKIQQKHQLYKDFVQQSDLVYDGDNMRFESHDKALIYFLRSGENT